MSGLIDMRDPEARRRAAEVDFFADISRGEAPRRAARRAPPRPAFDDALGEERISTTGRRTAAPAWDVHMAGAGGAAASKRSAPSPADEDEEQAAEMFEYTRESAERAEEEEERRHSTRPRLTGPQARYYNRRVERLNRVTLNARTYGDDELEREEDERVYVRDGKVRQRATRRVTEMDLDGSVDAGRVRRRAGTHLPGVHHFEDEEMMMQRESEKRSAALRARMVAAHGDVARRVQIT